MSKFINEYTILTAVKAILDADTTLMTLLDAKTAMSKVVLGTERPKMCSTPVIHLSFLNRTIDPDTKMNSVLIRVLWFVNAYPDGREDIETLALIGNQIYDLLDDLPPTVSGYMIDTFVAESGESSAKDIQEPENRENHFQSLTFRAMIRRIT